ncbi:uncharacterized protein isoform X2 [Danio rerio]|uniref:Uncharacterized protein isoform X2 n=1 Tax=Danio rerio TaxID=7955 RepID=A0AC58H8H5_DANRE
MSEGQDDKSDRYSGCTEFAVDEVTACAKEETKRNFCWTVMDPSLKMRLSQLEMVPHLQIQQRNQRSLLRLDNTKNHQKEARILKNCSRLARTCRNRTEQRDLHKTSEEGGLWRRSRPWRRQ